MKPILSVSIAGIVFILLHFLGIFLPVEYCWGYDSWGYVPGWVAALFVVLGLAACLIPAFFSPAVSFLTTDWRPRKIFFFLIPAVSFLPFWLLRQKSFFLGDGYFSIRTIENGVRYRALEPLETYFHAVFHSAANKFTVMSGEISWALVSCLAGVFYVLIAMLTGRQLGKTPAQKTLLFLSLVTIGTLQLYFGYIETYSLATLFSLVFFYFSIRSLENRKFVYPAFLGFALAVSAHVSMAAYAPAFVYLYFYHFKKISTWKKRLEFSGLVTGAFLLPLAVILLIFSAGGFTVSKFAAKYGVGGHLLPLLPYKFPPNIAYSMFSYRHIIDMANEYILIAPVLVFLPFVALLNLKHLKLVISSPITLFLLIASSSFGLFSFVFNMEIGISRDWDIFSSVAIPITLLSMLVIFEHLGEKVALGGTVIIGCCLLHTLPWIQLNSDPELSRGRFEKLTSSSHWNKHARSYAFDELRDFYEERGELKTSLKWGLKAYNTLHNERYRTNLAAVYNYIAIILAEEKRWEEAEPYFLNAYKYGPNDFTFIENIGLFYYDKKDRRNALVYFVKALELQPANIDVLRKTARTCYLLGRFEESDKYLSQAIRLNRDEAAGRELSVFRKQLDQKLKPNPPPGD